MELEFTKLMLAPLLLLCELLELSNLSLWDLILFGLFGTGVIGLNTTVSSSGAGLNTSGPSPATNVVVVVVVVFFCLITPATVCEGWNEKLWCLRSGSLIGRRDDSRVDLFTLTCRFDTKMLPSPDDDDVDDMNVGNSSFGTKICFLRCEDAMNGLLLMFLKLLRSHYKTERRKYKND
jgi:hypothetical protein